MPDVCEKVFSWNYASHDNDLTTCTQVIRLSHDFSAMTVLTTDQLTTLVGYIGHCIFWTPDWTNQLNNLPWRSYWDSNMCVFMHVGHICWPFWPCDNHRPVYINKLTTSMQWVEAAEAKKRFTAHCLVPVVTTHTLMDLYNKGCLAVCGNFSNNDWCGCVCFAEGVVANTCSVGTAMSQDGFFSSRGSPLHSSYILLHGYQGFKSMQWLYVYGAAVW